MNQAHKEQQETTAKALFLRPIDRRVLDQTYDEDDFETYPDKCLAVWVDQDLLRHQALRKSTFVHVSILRPPAMEPLLDQSQQERIKDAHASDAGMPATTVVARILKWKGAPALHHVALSKGLCSTLSSDGIVGGVLRLARVSPRMSSTIVEGLMVHPFATENEGSDAIRVKGDGQKERHMIAEKIKKLMKDDLESGGLDVAITDGQLLPKDESFGWPGGLIRFKGSSQDTTGEHDSPWCFWADLHGRVSVQQNIAPPLILNQSTPFERALPSTPAIPVGTQDILDRLQSQISYGSSALVVGSLGSGKTTLVQNVASRLRVGKLYHATFVPLQELNSNETPIATIKDTVSRLLVAAAWATRLRSRAVLILDDLDRLCPAETELQTTDNSRSRQISESLVLLIRQHCHHDSRISLLVTAQNADALHGLISASNIFKETIDLKAPTKDQRRKILQSLVNNESTRETTDHEDHQDNVNASHDSDDEAAAWMNGTSKASASGQTGEFQIDRKVDLLDVAGKTDGYMPGDLLLLISRAKNEAIIRTVENQDDNAPSLTEIDFNRALIDFAPASLRNVTLQSSRTTFDSVGGLRQTKRILLETLMYPTKYAPIFAQCPLRLRSGLLLYGYPGCGKTLLASAVAGECGLNFISVKGPEILNKYIGASEKSVRDLFERAESAKPCVLFFDEFDSIAPKRGHDSTGVTDRVVNQMLTQMDGAEGLSGVYVLAATSRPDLIDPALLRPGRLDKSLLCDMPGYDDRLDILRSLAKKLTIASSVLSEKSSSKNLAEIARRTDGYSGADLQAVVYNAHLEAIHHILGDKDRGLTAPNKRGKEQKSSSSTSRHDILQFPFDKTESNGGPATWSRAQQAADYAAIITKFDAMASKKKKDKPSRRSADSDVSAADGVGKDDSANKVVIEWGHLESSLMSTRSSIGAQERRRLDMIYKEFIVGRNGEMPDGEAVNEIGGRTSLM